jgi:Tol biopolymer transport system component
MPDSKAILYSSAESGHARRTYLLDIQGGTPRALTPEGTSGSLTSPDGKFLLAVDSKRERWLYPIAGGDPQKFSVVPNTNERTMGFSPDGRSVFLRTATVPVQITRVDIATGKRELWKEIVPADPAGAQSIPSIRFSADGKSYAYSVGRILSDLYVVDGLK